MNIRHLGIAIAALLAAGCITEGNYGTKLGATMCKKYQECDQESFDAQYDSMSDCKNEAEENANGSDNGDCLKDAGCKFQASAVKTCRSAINDASCDNLGSAFLSDDCTDIWNCDDADPMDVAACFTTN